MSTEPIPSPSAAVREPNAIYQRDQLVSRVTDARIDQEGKEVQFQELYNSDFLVLADEDSMKKAERALQCFYGTAKQKALIGWENVQAKTNSWKQMSGGVPA